MQVQWWGYHGVVGTLKPCHMLKNLFELIALKDDGYRKTLGASTSVSMCICINGMEILKHLTTTTIFKQEKAFQ